jgi:hypothetical protein
MVAPTSPDTSAGNGLLISIGVANVFLLASPVLMALVVACQAVPDAWRRRASMALGMDKYWANDDPTLPPTIAEATVVQVEMTDMGDRDAHAVTADTAGTTIGTDQDEVKVATYEVAPPRFRTRAGDNDDANAHQPAAIEMSVLDPHGGPRSCDLASKTAVDQLVVAATSAESASTSVLPKGIVCLHFMRLPFATQCVLVCQSEQS